jgi:hypothetical protein
MKVLRAASVIVGLAFLCEGDAWAQTASCEPLTSVGSMEMTDLSDGRISVPVAFADRSIPMLLSTGRIETSISDEAAHALNLMQQRVIRPVGRPYSYVALAHDLKIGNLLYKTDYLYVTPSSTSHDPSIQGVLGKDHIKILDVELDFARHRLELFEPDHCPGRVYWPAKQAVTLALRSDHEVTDSLSVTLDGKQLDAVIATGWADTYLTDYAAKMNFGLTADSPGMIRIPDEIAERSPAYKYVFNSLDLGGIVFHKIPVTIFRASGSAIYAFPMQLGMHELRNLRIYLAYQQRLMYASMADQTSPPSQSGGPPSH